MASIFGYVRCSTEQQDHKIQIDDLVAHGVPVENITRDFVSGGVSSEDRVFFGICSILLSQGTH
ncbi:MAG: hypothetical protein AAF827_07800 [Cyanobacteria bacterium P01_D01_bin.6]